jgi:D-galactarolactone cycloisomerase
MHRRDFLCTTGAILGSAAVVRSETRIDTSPLKNFKITKITGFAHVCPRPKFVGKNSFKDVHGDKTSENVLRIATDQGFEGVGIGSAKPDLAQKLIGRTLDEFWRPEVGVVSPLGRADHALYDLVGKALQVPIWKLFGGQGDEWTTIYDGSIYFADLLPQYESRGIARILEEVETSLGAGHRAFKIKVGRGHKWMEKQAGFERDVAVVQAIRKAVGKDVRLMVDANNGFDRAGAEAWLDAVSDELYFAEEMFPEEPEQDLEFKAFLKSKGWKTLVADGESVSDIAAFDSYIQRQAIDVYQPDIRALGLTLQWEMSRKLAPHPQLKLAPHNWGSHLGVYMQVTLARGIPNFSMAEQDTAKSDLIDTSAFVFKEGKMKAPDVPGCGLVLREEVFEKQFKDKAWTTS